MPSVWIVKHALLPTYSMYFRDDMYSEPIETVKSRCIAVYRTESSAIAAANQYADEIFEGDEVDRDDETGCHEWSAGQNGGDSGTWDQRIYVERMELH